MGSMFWYFRETDLEIASDVYLLYFALHVAQILGVFGSTYDNHQGMVAPESTVICFVCMSIALNPLCV